MSPGKTKQNAALFHFYNDQYQMLKIISFSDIDVSIT